jgi:hypothetical protein
MITYGESCFGEGVSEYNHYVNPKVDEKFGIPVSLLGNIFHRISKWQFYLEDWGKSFAAYIENEYLFKPSPDKMSYNHKSLLEYLDKCRYYDGSYDMPLQYKKLGKEIFWDYERIWVQKHFLKDGEDIKSNEKFFKDLIRYYKKNGLGHFSQDDAVPISFKALLFNRYEHLTGGTAEGFKTWYHEQYLKMPVEWCLARCLFYRGETQCPKVLKSHPSLICQDAWRMEHLWVREMTEKGYIGFMHYCNEAGLESFNIGDGVHRTLKEFLYGYGLHKAEGMLKPEEFIEWYDKQYIPLGRAYRNNDLR